MSNFGSRAHSRPGSETTVVNDQSNRISSTSIRWIAGLGDICNRALKDEATRRSPSQQNRATPNQDYDFRHGFKGKRSALQRHCEFWDTDNDSLIYPWDIYIGFRKLGFNIALCLWAAVSMAVCSSYSTQANWLPHPLFAINIDNIHRSRHGSTTTTYDLDAQIDMHRFNAIFDKYAEGEDHLTWYTLYNVWAGQCCANDWFGWFAGALECKALLIIFDQGFQKLTRRRDRALHSTLASRWQVEEGRDIGRFRWYHL